MFKLSMYKMKALVVVVLCSVSSAYLVIFLHNMYSEGKQLDHIEGMIHDTKGDILILEEMDRQLGANIRNLAIDG